LSLRVKEGSFSIFETIYAILLNIKEEAKSKEKLAYSVKLNEDEVGIFLRFLLKKTLIRLEDESYVLTGKGKEFLNDYTRMREGEET